MQAHDATTEITLIGKYMGEEMKVEIVSREIIKPSSPTPPNLKTYNLSLFDQLLPNVYISILLFYPAISGKDHEKLDNISKSLKSSLSKTLTQLYPFAGKVNDSSASIECNDEGTIFIKARVHGAMALVLEEYFNYSIGEKFLLGGNDPKEAERKDHLLQVQANFFECGGLVIGLSMSHRLGDASTMGTFIKAWSTTSLNSDNDVIDFSLPSIFPASTVPVFLTQVDVSSRANNLVAKRYVFDKSKISLLKEKAKSEGVKEPSRVECVCAILWKCLMAQSRSRVPSVFIQAVNLRRRITPQLPLNSIGNMVVPSIGSSQDHTIKTNLNDLIINMRRGLHDINEKTQKGLKTEEIVSYFSAMAKKVAEPSKCYESCSCSSWCRFPFYEGDFGWGKPTWVCPVSNEIVHENFFILVDTKDGVGIEAWCNLSEQVIALLEQDKEFLTFAAM